MIYVLAIVILAAAALGFKLFSVAGSVPQVGQLAPDTPVPSQDGATVRLADYRGKWVVLYFYPKDNTPG